MFELEYIKERVVVYQEKMKTNIFPSSYANMQKTITGEVLNEEPPHEYLVFNCSELPDLKFSLIKE
ncbi:MAG: hypothetical protein WCP46_00570 [Alphaproteobacteria bacterium]